MLAGEEDGVAGLWSPYPCCADHSPSQLPLGHSLVDPFCCHFILWLESQWKVNVPNSLVRTHEHHPPPQQEQTASGKEGEEEEGEEEEGEPKRCQLQLSESWNVS